MARVGEISHIAAATTRRNALKTVAGTIIAGAAFSSTALASEQATTCSVRFTEYQKAKADCTAAIDAHTAAVRIRSEMTPPVPSELIAPVAEMSFWNDLATHIPPERDTGKRPRRYFRADALAAFVADPPPSASHPYHVARHAFECARKLLPIAQQYEAALDHVMERSGENAAWAAYENAHDAEHKAVLAVLSAPIERVSDFRFKAQVMRDLLDGGLEVESETEGLVSQLTQWFATT